jgi:ornithine cyclodeaminase/alanine dehydrogenase-like protein (mu-crystallin family)
MRFLRQHDVTELLTLKDAIRLMREAFEALGNKSVSMPPRVFVKAERFRGSIAFMSAYVEPMNAMGMKAVALYEENPSRLSLPSILGLMLLFEADSGRTLAVMDGGPITTMRTAAVSALATDFLARKDARAAGFLGAGVQGRAHVAAMLEVRPIRQVFVFDMIPSKAEDYARWVSEEFGIEARAMPDAKSVVINSDIVTTATPSRSPILQGSWVQAGTHLNVIGSGPAVEIDGTTYARASKIVVDQMESAIAEAQDLLGSIRNGLLTREQIYAELCDLVLKRKIGRERSDEITIFRSLGLAIEDVVAAKHVYDLAIQRDRGLEVEFP